MKIILLVLGVVLVYWILKAYRRGIERTSAPPPVRSEDMLRCERCGVHLPRSEGVLAQGRFYCTPEHEREERAAR